VTLDVLLQTHRDYEIGDYVIRLWLSCSQVVAQRSSMGTQSHWCFSTFQARYHAREPEPCPTQTLCTSTRIFSPRRCVYFQSGSSCSAKGTSHILSRPTSSSSSAKQPNSRKKAEKRESSSRGLSVLSDDSQRKVKGTPTCAILMQCFGIHVLP
jgi:hypothetical protein